MTVLTPQDRSNLIRSDSAPTRSAQGIVTAVIVIVFLSWLILFELARY